MAVTTSITGSLLEPPWQEGGAGGDAYNPSMMQFDGSTGHYSKTGITTSGNAHTMVFRFKIGAFTGGSIGVVFAARGATSQPLILAQVIADDHASADIRGRLSVLAYNNAGTPICRLYTPNAVTDDGAHTVFFTFNGTAGTAEFIMDSVDVDDTGNASRVTPTTGTMDSGAASSARFGLNEFTTFYFPGQIGFAGYDDVGGLDYTDFMTTTGPKDIEATLATVWGGTPLFWNEHGDMENNQGSGGNMVKNGTIVVGRGGN